jgi:hypothetical protein
MSTDAVVREITRRAWRFGVSVLLSPDSTVDCDGFWSQGWFDGDDKKLVVGTGCDEQKWLGVLLHEYSHLTQWVERAPVWREDEKDGAVIDDWLKGKSVRNARKAVAARRELEADCERRTVRLIRELEAPIDLDRYIRGANSYIHFYNVIAEKRKWYAPGRGPYSVPEVLAVANPTLDDDFSKTPAALRAALLTCI